VTGHLSWADRSVGWLQTLRHTYALVTKHCRLHCLWIVRGISRVEWSYFLHRLPLHSWLNFINMPECSSSWEGNCYDAFVRLVPHNCGATVRRRASYSNCCCTQHQAVIIVYPSPPPAMTVVPPVTTHVTSWWMISVLNRIKTTIAKWHNSSGLTVDQATLQATEQYRSDSRLQLRRGPPPAPPNRDVQTGFEIYSVTCPVGTRVSSSQWC
jgi:hypothetical protein